MVLQLVKAVLARDGGNVHHCPFGHFDNRLGAVGLGNMQDVLSAAHQLAHHTAFGGGRAPRHYLNSVSKQFVTFPTPCGHQPIPLPLFAQDLPLVAQAHHWFIEQGGRITAVCLRNLGRFLKHAQIAHRFVEEARVQQVHRGVFRPACVGVHGQPVSRFLGVKRPTAVLRA